MKSILIIEDNKDIQLFLKNILTKKGYSVETANDGLEATKIIVQKEENDPSDCFDLIILDLMMPIMNGAKFLEQGLNFADTKILVISAKDSPSIIKACMENSASDYIVKPIDKDLIYDKIEALLQEDELEFSTIETRLPIYLEDDEEFQGMIFALSESRFSFLSSKKFNSNQVFSFICEDLAAVTGNDIHFCVRIISEEIKGKYQAYEGQIIGLTDSELTKLRIFTQSGKTLSYKGEEEEEAQVE